MNRMKTLLTLTVLMSGAVSVYASSHGSAPMITEGSKAVAPVAAASAPASADMANGEVRKVDMDSKKITIKHGEIKNLDMPGMTMVFQVKDAALLEKAKAGDKIRFRAEKAGGAIVVTDIQPVK